jgi:hypothetical protein
MEKEKYCQLNKINFFCFYIYMSMMMARIEVCT